MNEEIYDNQAVLSSDFFAIAEAQNNYSGRTKNCILCHLRKWICAFLGAGLQLQEKQNGSFEEKFHYLKLIVSLLLYLQLLCCIEFVVLGSNAVLMHF